MVVDENDGLIFGFLHCTVIKLSSSFSYTNILTRKSSFMDQVVREVTEIELHQNINKKDGFSMSSL